MGTNHTVIGRVENNKGKPNLEMLTYLAKHGWIGWENVPGHPGYKAEIMKKWAEAKVVVTKGTQEGLVQTEK